MTACPSSSMIDTEPPAASTRSRMWLSGRAAAAASAHDQVQVVIGRRQHHRDRVRQIAGRLRHTEVRRGLDPRVEAPTDCGVFDHQPGGTPGSSEERAERGREAGAGELGREDSAGDLPQRFQGGVQRVDQRRHSRGGPASVVALRRGWTAGAVGSGSGVRCIITCRAMDRSSRLRSASPAVTSRRRDSASSRLRWLSCSTSPESSAVSRALRKARPAWSARSASSRCSRGRSG